MKTFILIWAVFAGLTVIGTVGAAEKQKKADITGFPFWKSEKQPHAAPFVPGLNAALELTDAQRDLIAPAQNEFNNDEAVKASRALKKDDPSVTADQRDKARAAMEAATTRLHEKVNGILTPEQRALVEKINAARVAAVEEVGIVYKDKFGTIKADEAARRRVMEEKNQDLAEGFLGKLDVLLSASQKEAMARAAADEEQRMKTAVNKKPQKQ
jgi:hypothetical protein